MKFDDEQFQDVFGKFLTPPEVVGLSEKDKKIWAQGYSFAFSQLYDDLVVNGVDEDDKYFENLDKQLRKDKDES